MMENAPKLFFVSAFFIVITTVMSELEYRLPGTSAAYTRYMERIIDGEPHSVQMLLSFITPYGTVLAVLLALIRRIVEVGYKSYCLKMTRSRDGDYKDIFDGFLFFGKAMLILIVTTSLVVFWSMLFFFPGIAAYYRYRQALYILLDDPEKGVIQCIRESKLIMHGNKLDLFLLDITFIGWYALSIIIALLAPLPIMFPIVMIWLAPYFGLTQTAFYTNIVDRLAL